MKYEGFQKMRLKLKEILC